MYPDDTARNPDIQRSCNPEIQCHPRNTGPQDSRVNADDTARNPDIQRSCNPEIQCNPGTLDLRILRCMQITQPEILTSRDPVIQRSSGTQERRTSGFPGIPVCKSHRLESWDPESLVAHWNSGLSGRCRLYSLKSEKYHANINMQVRSRNDNFICSVHIIKVIKFSDKSS